MKLRAGARPPIPARLRRHPLRRGRGLCPGGPIRSQSRAVHSLPAPIHKKRTETLPSSFMSGCAGSSRVRVSARVRVSHDVRVSGRVRVSGCVRLCPCALPLPTHSPLTFKHSLRSVPNTLWGHSQTIFGVIPKHFLGSFPNTVSGHSQTPFGAISKRSSRTFSSALRKFQREWEEISHIQPQ